MAQHDTGLGWSALEEWLVSAPAEMGSISMMGGTSFPGQPVGRAATINDMAAVALPYQNNNNAWWTYIANDIDSVGNIVVFYYLDGNFKTWAIVSDASPITYHKANWFPNNNQWWGWDTVTTNGIRDASTGLYYAGISTAGAVSNLPPTPEFSSLRAGLDAIQVVRTDFTKTNSGYAVGCVARWKTQNGTELISPILISSNTEYTDMEESESGYNLAKLNYLLSGVRFYMAFWDIPGDTSITSAFPSVDLTDRGNITLDQLFMYIVSTTYAHVIIINSPDPYETEGAGSEEEGGAGEETGDDDAGIEAGSDFPSAINTGFCRIFSPSDSELRDLSNYLWSSSYDLEQVKKLFSNPMDSILGLSAVPIRLLGSSVSFSLGGVPITGMTLPLVTQQRYTYHMGTITIKERWGSYLDYDPYTKFSIFLPFIGMRELAADDIMGKTVSLVYDIDILTGMCVARLQAGTNCLYEWGGNCAIQLPINSRNWDSVFSTAVSAVGGIVSAVTGGSAPLVAGSVASAALQTVSMKPRIDKSSTIGGAAGWLGQMTPYIIRTTPEAFIPTDQNKFIGYPAYINVDLSGVVGYNEVESIHLENVTATGAELEEIESILKGGVIF